MLSRVADSLYWMGRYTERAEHTARLLAVKLESMIEQSPEEAEVSWMRTAAALIDKEPKAPDAFSITRALAFDRDNRSSLISSLAFARDNARQVREQLSTEVWEHLNRLFLSTHGETIESIWVHQPAIFFREILEDLFTLGGVTYDLASWRRLALHRAWPLHRTRATCQPIARYPFRHRGAGLHADATGTEAF